MPEIEFDQALNATWAEFHVDLTRHLVTMDVGESLLLESHYDSQDDLALVPASIRLSCQPGPVLRCEIPHGRFLHPLRLLTEGQSLRLRALGVRPPSLFDDTAPEDNECDGTPPPAARNVDRSSVYGPDGGQPNDRGEFGQRANHLDVDRDQVGRLADLALIVLREFWRVPDPSFLRADVDGLSTVPESTSMAPAAAAKDPAVLLPRLVKRTLARWSGQPPVLDADGDHLVSSYAQWVHVRALPAEESVEVFAAVLHEIPERPDTAGAIAALADAWRTGRLVLVEGSLLAVIRVDAAPFLPPHLLRAIEHVAQVATAAASYAEVLGGVPAEPAVQPAAAPLCSIHDHELIAVENPLLGELLGDDSEAQFSAQDAADAADGDLTALAEGIGVAESLRERWQALADVDEAYAWQGVAEALRAGLHLVTRPPVHEGQLELFDDED